MKFHHGIHRDLCVFKGGNIIYTYKMQTSSRQQLPRQQRSPTGLVLQTTTTYEREMNRPEHGARSTEQGAASSKHVRKMQPLSIGITQCTAVTAAPTPPIRLAEARLWGIQGDDGLI